jgi:replicative DNA helicase
MTPETQSVESEFLGCCLIDGQIIDKAVQAGVTSKSFANPAFQQQWLFLMELRLAGKETSVEGVYAAAAVDKARLETMGGIASLISHQSSTTAHADNLMASLLDISAKRESLRLALHLSENIKAGALDQKGIKELADEIGTACSGHHSAARPLPAICDEAINDMEEIMRGDKASRCLIFTGLPTFDRHATPMESHEYVVVGARTSHGKSSFLLQVAGNAIASGKRVVIFTLETSDKAVIKQIVGQRSNVNVRLFAEESPEKQKEYISKLHFAKDTPNLMVFDKDMTLEAIQARCRLLAVSFKPDLVIIDYLGLIGSSGNSPYERMSIVSKAMIPLKKVLGCTLMVGAQLSRSSESEKREPTRTDFRDAGGIEEDAHRIVALFRKPDQPLDLTRFDSSILQLKLRDGGLARIDLQFHGPHTKFEEITHT